MAPRKETREEMQRRLSQRRTPGWASRHDKPGSGFKMLFIILIAVGVAAGLMWLVFGQTEQPAYVAPVASTAPAPPQQAEQAPMPPAAPAKPAATVPAPLIPIPGDERHFANIIETAAQHYHPGSDIPADAERQRGQAVCQAVSSPHVSQWVGTVTALSSGQEHTILAIALDVQTAPAGGQGAAPAPSLPILMLASPPFLPPPGGVNPGETVTFSGDFIQDGTGKDCFQNGGQSADQALENPAFVMQLSDVKPQP